MSQIEIICTCFRCTFSQFLLICETLEIGLFLFMILELNFAVSGGNGSQLHACSSYSLFFFNS